MTRNNNDKCQADARRAWRNRRIDTPTSGFACQECGHKFRTVAAAEKAAFGDKGCPKCGSSDIDLS